MYLCERYPTDEHDSEMRQIYSELVVFRVQF